MDACENCGKTIGKLETPYLFDEHVVCEGCERKLSVGAKKIEQDLLALRENDQFIASIQSEITNDPNQMAGRAESLSPSSVGAVVLSEYGSWGEPLKPSHCCPACRSSASPVRKAKGNLPLQVVLLLIGILPGLLYFVFHEGYVFACPLCGYKYGEAA
jgi:hypothetical protein